MNASQIKLQRINPDDLNAKQKVAALLADYGFNCIKLSDDWQGADFLAYHKDGDQTLRVQLKGRVTIRREYLDKDLYMCFPVEDKWYLVPHDVLVRIVNESTNWLNTKSWREYGGYSSRRPSPRLRAHIAPYAIPAVR